MSPTTIHYLNLLLGLGAVALQALIVVTLFLLFFGRFSHRENKYLGFIKNNFIKLGFFLALLPVLFSTFYSEVLNYIPCFHCWVQRVFTFPQIFLYGVAWIRKDRNVFWYSWPLLLVGLVDSLYLIYIY